MEKNTSVVDSGCVENVAAPTFVHEVGIRPSSGSSRGQTNCVANGEDLPNLGEKTVVAHTAEGNEGQVTYQMAEVTKPLYSVGQSCDAGNLVIFGARGGAVLNIESRKVTGFKRVNRNYELEYWVKTPSQQPGHQHEGAACSQDVRRQGK